jgi:60S ribosomal protein uL30
MKQARNAALAKAAATAAATAAQDEAQFQKDIFAKAEKYAAEYEQLEETAITSRREAKANNTFFVPPEGKVVFVVRIRGTIGVSPKVVKILRLFRLRQINNGVFVRVNAATINMLRLIEPYIAYGYPNLKSTRELIYKRGHGKVSGQRIPLSSNDVVAAGLGEFGLNCVEDVIHEIFTVGPHFKEAANFLWPFKLNSPRHGYGGKKKLIHFNENGSCGMQGSKINHLIKRMI